MAYTIKFQVPIGLGIILNCQYKEPLGREATHKHYTHYEM